jgi:PEP-CTERM motif
MLCNINQPEEENVRRSGLLLGLMIVGFMAAVPAAIADQINLGDSSCTQPSPAPWMITSGPSVSGGPFICTNDASFSSGLGNISNLNWDISASGTTGILDVYDYGVNNLTGTFNLTGDSGLLNGLDMLSGLLTVTSDPSNPTTGFNNEYTIGGVHSFDLTLQGCSSSGGAVTCTDPLSGGIPVPEPGTFPLFGSGLIGLASLVRRKITRS